MFIFERERKRQRQSASRGGAEREREAQNPKQAPGSELSAQSMMWGLNSRTLGSWLELKSPPPLVLISIWVFFFQDLSQYEKWESRQKWVIWYPMISDCHLTLMLYVILRFWINAIYSRSVIEHGIHDSLKVPYLGHPGGSVKRPTLAQVMISVCGLEPHIRLSAISLEPT